MGLNLKGFCFSRKRERNVYRTLAQGTQSNLNYFNLNTALLNSLLCYLISPSPWNSQGGMGRFQGFTELAFRVQMTLCVLRYRRINGDVTLFQLPNSGASAKNSPEHSDRAAVPGPAEQCTPGGARGGLQRSRASGLAGRRIQSHRTVRSSSWVAGSGSGWLLVLHSGLYFENESYSRSKCIFFFFLCVCVCDRNNEPHNFISTYCCPQPSTVVAKAYLCTITGFILPEKICLLLEQLR